LYEQSEVILRVPIGQWQKILAYAECCSVEINGFGLVDMTGPNELTLGDVIITEQNVTAASAENTPLTIARLVTDMIVRGENPERLRLQWHSHVDMPASFSLIDTANIEQYDSDWMISLVVNRRGEYKVRLDVLRPFRMTLPVKIVLEVPVNDKVVKECQASIGRYVRTPNPSNRRRKVQLVMPGGVTEVDLSELALALGDQYD
jgi:hypothetical protein